MPNFIQPITIAPVDTVEALRQSFEIILNQFVVEANNAIGNAQAAATGTSSSPPVPSGSRGISSFKINTRTGKVTGLHGQNTGVKDTPRFAKVGVGTQAAAPLYECDIRITSDKCGFHISSADTDTGTYILNHSSAGTHISNGGAFNGSQWIAKAATASMVVLTSTGISFYFNSGLTPGVAYSPTSILAVDGSGNVVAGGNVSGGGTSLSALLTALGLKAAKGTYTVSGGGGGTVTI